jgi:hypothetical protein
VPNIFDGIDAPASLFRKEKENSKIYIKEWKQGFEVIARYGRKGETLVKNLFFSLWREKESQLFISFLRKEYSFHYNEKIKRSEKLSAKIELPTLEIISFLVTSC